MSGIETILPHRSPALLIREILAAGAGEALVRCVIPADSPWLRASADGRHCAPALILLEMAAQACAALQVPPPGAPAAGLVVSIAEAQLCVDELEADAVILARMRGERAAPPLRFCSFILTREVDGAELLRGTLSIYG